MECDDDSHDGSDLRSSTGIVSDCLFVNVNDADL